MNRILSIAICFCMTVAMCGCGSDTNKSQSASETETTTTETTNTDKSCETTSETGKTTHTILTSDPDITTLRFTKESTTIETTTTTTIPEPTEEDAGGVYDIDRGFFVTKVEIPFSVFEGFSKMNDEQFNPDEVDTSDWENNPEILQFEKTDNSYILTYKTSTYNKLKDEAYDNMMETFNGDKYCGNTSFVSVSADKQLENIYINVTSEDDYNKNWDGLSILGIILEKYMNCIMFDFSQSTTIHVIDQTTGEEFATDEYPKE